MKDQVLFPKIEVREKGFLQVSDIHTIYWERSGNPNGKKILVIINQSSFWILWINKVIKNISK